MEKQIHVLLSISMFMAGFSVFANQDKQNVEQKPNLKLTIKRLPIGRCFLGKLGVKKVESKGYHVFEIQVINRDDASYILSLRSFAGLPIADSDLIIESIAKYNRIANICIGSLVFPVPVLGTLLGAYAAEKEEKLLKEKVRASILDDDVIINPGEEIKKLIFVNKKWLQKVSDFSVSISEENNESNTVVFSVKKNISYYQRLKNVLSKYLLQPFGYART